MRTCKYMLCILAVFFFTAILEPQTISIPDAGFLREVRQKLGKPAGSVLKASECTRVFTLDLSSKQIKDITGIRYFVNLTTLDFSENEIKDIKELATLPNLLSLNLERNKIRFLDPLSNLPLLSELRIGYNMVEDISPLKRLKRLEKLYAVNNSIKDVSPLAGLVTLKELNLAGNGVTRLNGLDRLTRLEYLELSKNQILDISFLSGMKYLEYLGLGTNKIKDISSLKTAENIKVLNLQNNSVIDIYPISALTKLTTLRMNNNKISDIDYLADLNSLQSLNCAGNRIVSIEKLKACFSLENLNLSRNRITDIKALSSLEHLRILDLSENRIQDISPLESLKKIGKMGKKGVVHLSLATNRISDLSPLIRNQYMGKGMVVNISNNPLADRKASINALQKKEIIVLSFFLKGDKMLKEGGTLQVTAVEMVGAIIDEINSYCTWKVLRGTEYALFSKEKPGLLINTNESGKQQKIVILAEDTREGKNKKAYALVAVESTPRLKEVVINGVNTLGEDSAFQFYAIAVWDGKPDENITKKVAWSISEGKEFARFDKESPGKLINTNTTGQTRDVVIACAFKHKGKDRVISKRVKSVDIPTVISISVAGPSSITRGAGGGGFTAVCHWNGKEDEDITKTVKWSVSGKLPYARFDPEKPGYLVHTNRTGNNQKVTVSAVLTIKKESWKAEKSVSLTDDPYITAISVIGPGSIKEDGSGVYKIKAEWRGRDQEETQKGVTWLLTKGKEYASFDPKSGALTNKNNSGNPAEAVLSAEYTGGGVTKKALKKIVLEDVPFVKGLVIQGSSLLNEDGSAAYSVILQWVGKEDEESPQGISWRVLKGAEYISLTEQPLMSVTNKNTTGKNQLTAIKAEYTTAKGKSIAAEKEITVQDTPYISGVKIEGADALKKGESSVYKAVIMWKGKPDQNGTSEVKWQISKGEEWIRLDPEKPGTFVNINTTGKTQDTEISVFLAKGIDMHSGSKTVKVTDPPFAIGISIQGPISVEENGSCDFSIQAELSDGQKADRTKEAEWKIITGSEYAEFDIKHAGRLVNRNRTGTDEAVTFSASFKGLKKHFTAKKAVSAISKPFISSLGIEGPDTAGEGQSIQFKVRAVWIGKGNEDVTLAAKWDIESGKEYGHFEKELPGILVNDNDTGSNKSIAVKVSYSMGGTEFTQKKTVVMEDTPVIESIYITGLSSLLEDTHTQYAGTAVWKGKEKEDVTAKIEWKVIKGEEWAVFDMDVAGRLLNTNKSGEPQTAVVQAEYSEGGITKRAEKTVAMLDVPYLKGFEVTSDDAIPIAGHIDITSVIIWSDGKKEEQTGKTYWEIVEGKEFAEFDSKHPGRLVNRNKTGKTHYITFMCCYTTLTECVVGQKKISAESKPSISSIEITGPDIAEQGQSIQFTLRAAWVGKEAEDVTAQAVWSIVEGDEYALFDAEQKGLLINTSLDPEDMIVTLQAAYTHEGAEKTAEKQIVIKGSGE